MITFRRMVPEDADALAVVEEKCFSVPWSREAFWRDASNTDAYYLLAIDTGQNDRIIGYVGCWILAYEAVLPMWPLIRNTVGRELAEKCC